MKKLLLALSASLLLAAGTKAQIQIGGAEIPTMGSAGRLDEEDLEAFKKTTTVFIVQTKDEDRIGDFEEALKDVWTITPYKVITPDKLENYSDGHRYSYFGFGGFIISNGRSGATSVHLTYDLSIDRFKKNGDTKGRILLARFFVSPDPATLEKSVRGNYMFGGGKKYEREMLRFMYTQSEFRNWGAGYLKGYAKFINDALQAKKRRGIFDSDHDKDKMKALVRDTLWLPNSIKLHYQAISMFGGNREEEDAWDDADLHKAYPYAIAYIDDAALQDKILHSPKPVYYLIYARSSTEKYVDIFEGRSGEQIYTEHTSLSYNIKLKDVRRIAGIID